MSARRNETLEAFAAPASPPPRSAAAGEDAAAPPNRLGRILWKDCTLGRTMARNVACVVSGVSPIGRPLPLSHRHRRVVRSQAVQRVLDERLLFLLELAAAGAVQRVVEDGELE